MPQNHHPRLTLTYSTELPTSTNEPKVIHRVARSQWISEETTSGDSRTRPPSLDVAGATR